MAQSSFKVNGQLINARTKAPMIDYSIITETGIRDNNSPLCMISVGPISHTDNDGRFLSSFTTSGTSIPNKIEVHIEIRPGDWFRNVISIAKNMVQVHNERNIYIDVGKIRVNEKSGA